MVSARAYGGGTYGGGLYADSLPGAGLMAADIWSPDGSVRYGTGPLVNFLGATRTRRINAIGDYAFTVPATDPNQAYVSQGREVRIFREGEGELWRGIIEQATRRISPTGEVLLDVSGRTLASELARAPTLYGTSFQNASITSALTTLLALGYTTWTSLVTGGNNITGQFDGIPLWQALLTVATIGGGYLRETNTPRQLEFKVTNAISGLRMQNVESIDPVSILGSSLGIILGVPTYTQDGGSIVNRVIPYGAPQNGAIYDLSKSTLSGSPYTISTQLAGRPNQAQAASGALFPISAPIALGAGGTVLDTTLSGGPSSQSTVAIVLLTFQDATTVATKMTIGGKSATQLRRHTAGVNRAIEIWYVINPLARDITSSTLNSTVFYSVSAACRTSFVCTYLNNVDVQTSNWSSAVANGTSTVPSVTIASDVNSIVLNACLWISGTALTPDAAFTTLSNSNAAAGGFYNGWKAGAATITATHALAGAATDWLSVSLTIPGYKSYYIEDTASVNTYQRTGQILNVPDLKIGDFNSLPNSADALYNYAATWLARKAVLPESFQFDVVNLPLAGWLPGDKLNVNYRGFITDLQGTRGYLDIESDLICLEATDSYNAQGGRTWSLKMARALVLPLTIADTLSAISKATAAGNTR